MRKILVTGGTTFVSRFVAEYFAGLGDEVYVLNRGSKPQSRGVVHICADRHNLTDTLKGYAFDAVLDITAYTAEDVEDLLSGLGEVGEYVLVSSSAVYPENTEKPFSESAPTGDNGVWGAYGTNKIAAERALTEKFPRHYILRPPYLYGPMQNLYREGFVFDCAMLNRVFVLPPVDVRLQFFHVEDLCRFINILITEKPPRRIYNVGNPDTLSIREWVALCYDAVGKSPDFVIADKSHPIRNYFCFYDYDYALDVDAMLALMPDTIGLARGLRESFLWFKAHRAEVNLKPYIDYMDKNGML